MIDLKPILGRWYDATVLHIGKREDVRAEFHAAMADRDFAKAARVKKARLDELDRATGGRLAERDYVGSVHRDFLKEMLG